jgi:hypothetical protein
MSKHDHRHARFRGFDHRFSAPQVSAGWFQRPYPYHLDYYKMRYGGSYAPYFGNLYGPPQVVTAPPYYGPYYGGFEFANPNDGAPLGMPGFPNGGANVLPPDTSPPNVGPADASADESLPAP